MRYELLCGVIVVALALLAVIGVAEALGPYSGGVPWVPVEMAHPIIVKIVSPETLEKLKAFYGINPGAGAFALWSDNTCHIFLRTTDLQLFPHEVRHCQQGHFH